MGSFSGVCEIVEGTEEPSSSNHFKGNHQLRSYATECKPPRLKKGSNSSLEDDTNKLFEAISLRATSKGVDLPNQGDVGPSKRTNMGSSKKPMRVGHAQGIGFSHPVSLKQALRGLSISQASEMAAMKRLSNPPGSSVVSEAGKITRFYGSFVDEAGESRLPLAIDQKGRAEISLVPQDRTLNSSDKKSIKLENANAKSLNKSVESSPRFVVKPTPKNMDILGQIEFLPATTEIQSQSSKRETEGEGKHTSVPTLPCHNSIGYASELNKNTCALSKVEENNQISNISSERKVSKYTSSSKVAGRTVPKVRHKGRLESVSSSSSSNNSNKLSRSTRNVSHVVKTTIRNKNFASEKVNQDPISLAGEFNVFNDVRTNLDLSNGQLICQRCKCALKHATEGHSKKISAPNSACAEVSSSNWAFGAIKRGIISKSSAGRTTMVKTSMNSKSKAKGEFSQSSKSSIGDYNSSSNSPSEDSILSGSSSDRPHMSKDLKWEAIHHIRKQHGNLALRHFNLLKKLGCGDIGTVYLAELIGTNCLFAIKVMDNEYLARRKKMPRAQTEREILRMLDHPFLPTLYAQFVSDNLSCLIMEYCPGGDLHVLRQKQPERYFPEQAARFYVAEVVLALEYLHMLGVVYRDLKPENILVREDGHIMLTDFDLSLRCSVNPILLKSQELVTEPPRMSGPSTQASCIDPFCVEPSCQVSCFSPRLLHTSAKNRKLKHELALQVRSLPQLVAEPTDARSNSFVGTHEYLAPEIIKGEGHGSAVDWWTLGIFLYELLYGKTPFKGSGNDETLQNVILESLEFPDSPLASFHASDLIRRLLVKEPGDRLGYEKGAAEIKQHPFFVGLNWALIRCTVPPQIPESCDAGVPVPEVAPQDMGRKYLEYRPTGEHLEFELF